MLEIVTKEDTGDRLSGELGLLPGRKQDKATIAKDTKMIISEWCVMKTLTRTTTMKKRGGLEVNKINCSTNGICPEMGRERV